ncbi:unnamed protein product [Cladocopium goreaui]|uniref:Uncharacterized protein n=1 Tax=Cladocopium goreaui TaxID=2562237 RepID=A0A9P1GCM3_9DINO|nr:unnamed protein product [Cladocopium goreaui]CAI4012623.1 unnamed protein product [Cladocopium goreaui]
MVLDETTFTLVGEMGLDWFEGVTSLQDLNVLGNFEARPHSKVELWLSACWARAASVEEAMDDWESAVAGSAPALLSCSGRKSYAVVPVLHRRMPKHCVKRCVAGNFQA